MVGMYPAAAALRRRAARMEANGEAFPEQNAIPRPRRRRRSGQAGQAAHPQQQQQPRLSRLYFLASALVALLAIISSSTPTVESSSPAVAKDDLTSSVENVARAAAAGIAAKKMHQNQSPDSFFKTWNFLFKEDEQQVLQGDERVAAPVERTAPALFRWMMPPVKHDHEHSAKKSRAHSIVSMMISLVDPSLRHPQPSTPTDIIDKILTSTPRILAIANLLLAMTYLLHSAVANMFLGSHVAPEARSSWAGRERLGGFLVFKLLLISAVVAPDTLDLLILLSWYTLLSFLRSLAHLAAATTAHTSQSGQPPQRGVLRLLSAVLLSDFLAAASCVALFHGAGWGMVLLLTCDCALLAVDVLGHALQHVSQVMDEAHSYSVGELEERQMDLHTTLQQSANETTHHEERNEDAREESRQLDRNMEALEALHARRVGVLDSTIFSLQLLSYGLTVTHFLHIWSLHGLQFTLIDGVLALHLHSALSAAGKKIAERRNLNRIARDLDGLFEDAPEMDMRKAGDVCCICLVTMTTGNVKKVACGHLYHTHCLREVVERARSIEAARCPLCRASVLDGRYSVTASSTVNEVAVAPVVVPNNDVDANAAGDGNVERQVGAGEPVPPQQQGNNTPGEHALFRFSTESILPAWLPLPAFSFEVVRRPPMGTAVDAAAAAAEAAPQEGERGGPAPNRPSFLRRLLILMGAIPMSPEEEARALEQLVDMFPQYDRADLLRELRERGSSEAVVEAVLVGVFAGVPRGGNALVQPPPQQVIDVQDDEEEEGTAQ